MDRHDALAAVGISWGALAFLGNVTAADVFHAALAVVSSIGPIAIAWIQYRSRKACPHCGRRG